jgi:hypothetical protein
MKPSTSGWSIRPMSSSSSAYTDEICRANAPSWCSRCLAPHRDDRCDWPVGYLSGGPGLNPEQQTRMYRTQTVAGPNIDSPLAPSRKRRSYRRSRPSLRSQILTLSNAIAVTAKLDWPTSRTKRNWKLPLQTESRNSCNRPQADPLIHNGVSPQHQLLWPCHTNCNRWSCFRPLRRGRPRAEETSLVALLLGRLSARRPPGQTAEGRNRETLHVRHSRAVFVWATYRRQTR